MVLSTGSNTRVLIHVATCIVWSFLTVRVNALTTYKIEEYCLYTVSRYETAGVLVFNTSTFFDRQRNARECTITVGPEQLPGSRNGKVLFYFSEFNLPGTCADLNVTLIDGSSRYDSPVLGATNALCGRNYTVTQKGAMFNTSGSDFAVTIRWTGSTPMTHGAFVLKFASFYSGPCDEDVITCSNSRCTAKEYHCHADIDTCGGGEDDVCTLKEVDVEGFLESMLNILKNLGILIAIGVGLSIGIKVLKSMKFHGQPLLTYIRNLFGNNSGSQTEVRVRSRAPSIQTLELNQQTDTTRTPAQQEISLEHVSILTISETSDTDSDQGGPAAPPPAYDVLTLRPTAPPIPSAAPPSYDDVISDADRYMYKK